MITCASYIVTVAVPVSAPNSILYSLSPDARVAPVLDLDLPTEVDVVVTLALATAVASVTL